MPTQTRAGAVIVAAGSSSRMAGVDKIFAPIAGRPLVAHTLDRFEECPQVGEIVLVLAAASVDAGRRLVADAGYRKVAHICPGGASRRESVLAGLAVLQPCRWVMVHDGARPGVDGALLARGLEAVAASPCGAVAAGVSVKDTIKVVNADGQVVDTPPRESLWAAQTPQIFAHDLLCQAYAQYTGEATDDAMVVEAAGYQVTMFPGSYENLKVTTPEDLAVMEAILRGRNE